MLNTFYHRSCFEFSTVRDPTATCQPFADLVLILVAAVGGGIAMSDERVAILGFLIVHIGASTAFVIALVTPSLMGFTDPSVFSVIISQAIILAFKYQFPFALFFTLMGSLLGLLIGGKLPTRGLWHTEQNQENDLDSIRNCSTGTGIGTHA